MLAATKQSSKSSSLVGKIQRIGGRQGTRKMNAHWGQWLALGRTGLDCPLQGECWASPGTRWVGQRERGPFYSKELVWGGWEVCQQPLPGDASGEE